MMRKRLWASIAVLSTSAGSAFAGGGNAPAPGPSQSPVVWTGCYAGLHAGAAAGNSNWSARDSFWEVASASMGLSGAIAGGQIGCNYQIQNFVLGAEGEVWGSGLTGDTAVADFEGTTSRLKTHSDIGSDLSLRGGYAIDRLLVYGKLGVAWADYRFSDTNDFEGFTETGADSEAGLLIGLGAEYAIDAHWSVEAEFDYVNFGRQNVAMNGDIPYAASIQNNQDIFKIGGNYRF